MDLENFRLAYNLLNKSNQNNLLNILNVADLAGLENKLCNSSNQEIENIEKCIINEYSLMDKNKAYILCKVITKRGDDDFNEIKRIPLNNRIMLFQNSEIDDLNWFELPNDDKSSRKFAFYKLKKRKWKEIIEGEEKELEENRLLVF